MSQPGQAVDRGPEDDGGRARWDDRYRAKTDAEAGVSHRSIPDPPPALIRLASLIPTSGRALDLAGGDGGGALFLGRRGLEPTVVDVSPVALDRAVSFAAAEDLPLATIQADLGRVPLTDLLDVVGWPTPTVITCCNYLHRPLLASVAGGLPSGARFVVAIATSTNLERHARPSARFLLEPGELVSLVVGQAPSRLRILHRREGWSPEGHRAELVVEAR